MHRKHGAMARRCKGTPQRKGLNKSRNMRVSKNFTGVGVGVRESQENPKLTPSFQPATKVATKVATFRCESVPGRVD